MPLMLLNIVASPSADGEAGNLICIDNNDMSIVELGPAINGFEPFVIDIVVVVVAYLCCCLCFI
jgi:hypothetical protein